MHSKCFCLKGVSDCPHTLMTCVPFYLAMILSPFLLTKKMAGNEESAHNYKQFSLNYFQPTQNSLSYLLQLPLSVMFAIPVIQGESHSWFLFYTSPWHVFKSCRAHAPG